MTLEDFFTLSEMNNGLTTPSRVKELVTVMVNERHCTVKNVVDVTRQWSAVANAVAATENKDCLDLFIQLDGLQFIFNWLKDAQNFSKDTSDSFVEESIIHLLQVLVKLHVNDEKLLSAEIWSTVKDLLFHNNSKVQDKARVLFGRKKVGDSSIPDVEYAGALTADGMGKSREDPQKYDGSSEYCAKDISLSSETPDTQKVQESIRDDPVQSPCSVTNNPDQLECESNSDKLLDTTVMDDKPLDHIISSSSNPAVEACPTVHNSSAKLCLTDVCQLNTLNYVRKSHESTVNDTTKIENSSDNLGPPDKSEISQEMPFPSSLDAANDMNYLTENIPLSVSGDKSLHGRGPSFLDSKTSDFDGKVAMRNRGHRNQRQCSSALDLGGRELNHNVLWSSSSGQKHHENLKNARLGLTLIDDGGTNIPDLCIRDDMLSNDYNNIVKEMDREYDFPGKKTSIKLDYGIVDPLEFARQVAIEVEREVVDYREQSCSSDKLSDRNAQRSHSPDSVSHNRSHDSDVSSKEAADDPSLSAETSSVQEQSETSSAHLDAEQANGPPDMEISLVSEVSQEDTNKGKALCNFDLNVDVCAEDADHPVNQFSAPVSVVSASRAVAALGLPLAPLKFEGNLGWKGSAATSAFRPASSHRMPENDKDPSTLGSSGSSKLRQRWLDIDLNVAESGGVRIGDQSSDKHVLATSSLLFGESSVEMNSRSEHIELDLNLVSEDGGGIPTDWRFRQLFPHTNVHQSLSNSSSSSAKQPSLKNIDLNDHPYFPNGSSDITYSSKVSQNYNFSGGMKSDDSVISIMGKRVEVSRKDFTSQTLLVPHNRTSELPFEINMGRNGSFVGIGSVLPYAHSSVYSCTPAPVPPAAMPFPAAIYGSNGSIPYMVDSRGAPIIPQVMGSNSALPMTFSQPSFFLSTANSDLNGIGPSRSSFDLNSGTLMEGANRDSQSLGRFLNSVPVRSVDEQLRLNSQPSVNSVIGGKRKEPENGWEHFPYNPHTPPWI